MPTLALDAEHPVAGASRRERLIRWASTSPWAPVIAAAVFSALLQILWRVALATSGGDIAAQDAWAEFAREHPNSAYDLAWYGGMHPVSYSVLSPYVMALLGVRTTMMLASVVATAALAYLLTSQRLTGWWRYLAPCLGALGFFGNSVSGRVTFGLGTAVALVALVALLSDREPGERPSRSRLITGAVLAGISTACSPVSGLFLGIIAAALWLTGRRGDAYLLGLPPVVVVVASALLFPFSGQEPMQFGSAILPAVAGLSILLLCPPAWKVARVAGGVYLVAVIAAWLVASPVGTNISRLGLVAGVAILAAAWVDRAAHGWGPRRGLVVTGLVAAMITGSIWQVAVASKDAVHERPPVSWTPESIQALVDQLQARHAMLGRVEVVPSQNHREQTALATYVPLARGWNRQVDVGRNPLFYAPTPPSPAAYQHWLKRWAVRFVVLPTAPPDPSGGLVEANLVRSGLPYLQQVWSNRDWRLYAVAKPASMISAPGSVRSFTSSRLVVRVPEAGDYVVKVAHSPWLSLVDAQGARLTTGPAASCLSDLDTDQPLPDSQQHVDDWVVLHAMSAGTYRISAPYHLPRGSACPS